MKNKMFLFFALAVFAFQNCKKDKKEIFVPAGSNVLAQILADAEDGSTIRLGTGLHTEDTSLVITKQICLVGEEGAVLKVKTNTGLIPVIDPAIYVMDVANVCIQGIDFQPFDVFGNTGVFLENSPDSRVENCTFIGHVLSIVVQTSNNVMLTGNTIKGTLYTFGFGHGIVWVGGKNGTVSHNNISDGFFGFWPCDENGTFDGNEVSGCAYAVVPCKVVQGNMLITPRSENIQASITATNWSIKNNEFHHNQWGVGLADESNHCTVTGNNFHENGNAYLVVDGLRQGYDVELLGEYPLGNTRFGVSIAPGHDNTIVANASDRIKDCSGLLTNSITGGMLITTDSCN